MRRWIGRLAAVGAGLVTAVTFASAAYAHTEIEIEPAVAGSVNAVMTVHAASESTSSGVVSVRIVLPAGIAPTAVALRAGPTAWALSPTDDGYIVSGPALPVGQDAEHSVTIARLPEETRLVIRTLVTYADGSVDRWIEEPTAANPRPENPAPVVTLAPNPNPAPPTTEPPTPAATTVPVTSSPAPAAAPGDPVAPARDWAWWVIAAVVIVAAITAAVVVRRRAAARG